MIDVLLEILQRHGTDYDTVILVSSAADIVGVCEDEQRQDDRFSMPQRDCTRCTALKLEFF